MFVFANFVSIYNGMQSVPGTEFSAVSVIYYLVTSFFFLRILVTSFILVSRSSRKF